MLIHWSDQWSPGGYPPGLCLHVSRFNKRRLKRLGLGDMLDSPNLLYSLSDPKTPGNDFSLDFFFSNTLLLKLTDIAPENRQLRNFGNDRLPTIQRSPGRSQGGGRGPPSESSDLCRFAPGILGGGKGGIFRVKAEFLGEKGPTSKS